MHRPACDSGIYKGSVAISGGSGLVRSELNPDADPDGYLYGRVVVFTGTLMAMTRQIAWDECSRVGAIAERATTKRTNVLVIGDINPAVLRPGSNLTGKARRAFELQDQGQAIEVMTEDDFLRCLDGKPLAAAGALLHFGDENLKTPSAEPIPSRLHSVPLGDRPKPEPPNPQNRPSRCGANAARPTRYAVSTGAAISPHSRHDRSRPGATNTSLNCSDVVGSGRLSRSPTPTIGN